MGLTGATCHLPVIFDRLEQSALGQPTATLWVFVLHEFGVSGHGDDRRPRRCAWTYPRGILFLTTGMRLRAATGTVLIWRSGTSSSSSSSSSSLSVRRAEGRPRRCE